MNGSEIPSLIQELRITQIAYYNCNDTSGPLRVILKSDIFMIVYSYGFRELISKNVSSETENFKSTEAKMFAFPICDKILLKDQTIKYGIIKKINKSTIKFSECDINS